MKTRKHSSRVYDVYLLLAPTSSSFVLVSVLPDMENVRSAIEKLQMDRQICINNEMKLVQQKLLTSCSIKVYLGNGQLHISINGHGSSAFARHKNTNFISLFLHIYLSV